MYSGVLEQEIVCVSPFHSLFNAAFFTFLCCSLVMPLFKMAPGVVRERCVVFLKCRQAMMCLTETIRVSDKLHVVMSYSTVAVSSMLMNQQHICKLSLHRNTCKAGCGLIS